MVPIVAIVMEYRYKIEKLRAELSRRGSEDLKNLIEALRSDHEGFVLGFDARLKKLESRIARLEAAQPQGVPSPAEAIRASTHISSDTETVAIHRTDF